MNLFFWFEFLHGVYLAKHYYCSCMGRLQNLTSLILAAPLTFLMNEANLLSALFRASSLHEWDEKCSQRLIFIHGHRTLKAPHPVRSAQLTRVPPS
jgi:hypothetical protein